MLKRPATWLAAALTAVALLFSACSVPSNQGSEGKTLRFITVYPANTTDAHQIQAAFIFNSGTVETLVGLDPQTLKLRPWLAEKWDTADAQNWTFTIRKGVKFHNGTEVTAEKVKASLENAVSVNPGLKKALRIQSMEASDQYTLKVVTETVYPALPSNLVHYNSVIVDTSATDAKFPIGTGAFKFESFDIAGEAVLVRNDDYYDGKAKLDRVVMTANEEAPARLLALQSGDADVIYRPALDSLSTIEGDSNLQVDSHLGTRVYHLLYNYTGANASLWNNEEFRKGIDALVDRESIVKDVMGGQAKVAYDVFPGDYPMSPKSEPHPFGAEEALKHFEAAGLQVSDGKVTQNGQPLSLKLATYDARPELPQIAQVVQDQARKVGIEMEIKKASNIDEELPKGAWDLATYSLLTITRGDGSFFLNSSFGKDAAQNHGHLDDPELLAKLEKYNIEFDETARATQAKEIAQYVENKYYNSYITVPFESAASKKTVTGWTTPGNEFEFQMITKDLDIS
ncbi:MAG: ABC transporter substrate-binding protein [Propionibacterium sp.]|nr:ABC transporter substrate-binding protein [Propionibacterium sp.]